MDGVIDADPIAAAVRAVMTTRTEWTGTASELLGALAELAGERIAKSKTRPDSPRALAGRLRRAATFLRKIGIEIGFEREGRARTRVIRISTAAPPETGEAQPSASSAPSTDRPGINPPNEFGTGGMRTVGDPTDGPIAAPPSIVCDNRMKFNDAVDADANHPPRSERDGKGVSGWSMRL